MELIKCVSNTAALQYSSGFCLMNKLYRKLRAPVSACEDPVDRSFTTNKGTVCFCVASGFADRLVGLLSRTHMPDDIGLYFPKCSAVHTFGMRFSIDVLFLDADCRVVKIVTMNPWRVQSVRGASSVLELNAGAAKIHELKIGQILWTL